MASQSTYRTNGQGTGKPAHKPVELMDLPTELLCKIADYAIGESYEIPNIKAATTLSLVNRRFYGVATRRIYREFTPVLRAKKVPMLQWPYLVHHQRDPFRFLRSLMENKILDDSVKHLGFNFIRDSRFNPWGSYAPSIDHRIMKDGLKHFLDDLDLAYRRYQDSGNQEFLHDAIMKGDKDLVRAAILAHTPKVQALEMQIPQSFYGYPQCLRVLESSLDPSSGYHFSYLKHISVVGCPDRASRWMQPRVFCPGQTRLHIQDLAFLFQLSSLRRLTLINMDDNGSCAESIPLNWPASHHSSPIEVLELEECSLQTKSLLRLVNACKSLKAFELFHAPGDQLNLPPTQLLDSHKIDYRGLYKALRRHPRLEKLVIKDKDIGYRERVDPMESLVDMAELKHLVVPLRCLKNPVDPTDDYLPPSLITLEVIAGRKSGKEAIDLIANGYKRRNLQFLRICSCEDYAGEFRAAITLYEPTYRQHKKSCILVRDEDLGDDDGVNDEDQGGSHDFVPEGLAAAELAVAGLRNGPEEVDEEEFQVQISLGWGFDELPLGPATVHLAALEARRVKDARSAARRAARREGHTADVPRMPAAIFK